MSNSQEAVFLRGRLVELMPLGAADVSQAYLEWLNDKDVLRFRGPKSFPTTMAQLKDWVAGLPARGDLVLAIRVGSERKHIGNISLNDISWGHRSADLAIMIGAKDVWGHGYGADAISTLTTHAFRSMGLHRLSAQSPNPGFNAAVKKLGWRHEGTRREAFLLDGGFADLECWGILASEWRPAGAAESGPQA